MNTVAPPIFDCAKVIARIIARDSVLGRYEIVGSIGAGGMADVWLGRSTGHGGFARLLAIKTARPSFFGDPRLRAVFLREGALAAGIRHANVLDVLNVGEAGGVLFPVMSLVEGDSFAGLLQTAPLPLGVTLGIGIDAFRCLHAAHELGIVHRDVSPQNILVGLDGLARISDFGIANMLSDDVETTGTRMPVSAPRPRPSTTSAIPPKTCLRSLRWTAWRRASPYSSWASCWWAARCSSEGCGAVPSRREGSASRAVGRCLGDGVPRARSGAA